MPDLLNVLLPVFLLITSGIIMRHRRFLPEGFWASLDRLNYFVLFPALLFQNLADATLDHIPAGNVLLVVWVALALVSFIALVARGLIGTDGASFTSVFQGGIRFSSYIALGTIPALFGQKAAALTAVLVVITVPTVNVLCVIVLSVFGTGAGVKATEVMRSVASNPLILACMAGWIVNQTGLEPAFIANTIKSLGAASLPCGLISVGAALTFGGLVSHFRPITASLTLKFALLPLSAWLACNLFGVPDDLKPVLVFFHALPTAPASYVLARQLGGNHQLMASIITAQTLAAFIVMPLVFWLVSG